MSPIDHWDWARYALGIALILCNAGVWRGVALEESLVSWDRETGKKVLIRSLALEALFAALLFVVDTVASVQQKAEIAALNAEIAPRTLTAAQEATFAAALRPFQGRQVFVYKYIIDPESRRFAIQLSRAISAAGISIKQSGIPQFPQITVIETVLILGVFVDGPPSEQKFVEAIETALRAANVVVIPSPNGPRPEGQLVEIVVGNKPLPP
jgi:hypothetical protein